MRHVILAVVFASYAWVSTALEVDFGAMEFSSGIPEGWQEALSFKEGNNLSFSDPETIVGRKVLSVNMYNASSNATRIVYRSEPLEDVECDNVSVDIIGYHKRGLSGKLDKIQMVISTDNFQSYVPVGNPVDFQELGRVSDGWVTNRVSAYIEGLSSAENKNNVLIGFKMIAMGASRKYGYVGGLKVDFVASATPSKPVFVVEDEGIFSQVQVLNPGEENARISVNVSALPVDSISSTNVYAIVNRDGITTNMPLSCVGGANYVSDVLTPALDAGEEFSISICTKYKAYSLPTLGDREEDGFSYEYDYDAWTGTVAKKGSVWINELVSDGHGLSIEFAGTTNRVMTSGWSVVVSNDLTETELPITGVLNFTNNLINGVVGLDVRTFGGDTLYPGTNVLRLVNSRGVCECEVGIVKNGGSLSYAMTGIAIWHDTYSYDWTGTGADFYWTGDNTSVGIFRWGDTEASTIGQVNNGQEFKVPFSVPITVIAKTETGGPLPYAMVYLSASNVANIAESTLTTTNVQTSVDGVAEILFEGYSGNTSNLSVVISSSAFGWGADDVLCDVVLAQEEVNEVPIEMTRRPAYDDCDALKAYWSQPDALKWEVDTQGTRRFLKINLYNAGAGTNSVMTCVNSLFSGGKKCVSVSFDFRNTVNSTMNRYNELCVEFGTNSTWSGTVLDAAVLSNKRSEYGNNEWYSYNSVTELPEGFEESELWLRLVSRTKTNASYTYLYLDNLRIAFQDAAMPTNLNRSVAAPVNGESTAFSLDVVPQTSDEVQEVSADLHLVLNGVTNIVPFAFSDGTLTNSISLVNGEAQAVQMTITAAALEEALGGPFMTGDEVTYFAAVRYNSANGAVDPAEVYETRYFPDNATTSNEYWIVEGNYGVGDLSANTFTVTGDALSCIGTPEVTTEGVKFTLHGYDANGISALTVNVNGTDYHPFEGLDTNAQVRVTGEFELPTGLAANTDYTVTITAKDANGADIAPASFTFTTLPVATSAAVEPVSQTETRLTVSGSAAGYVVPEGWTQTGSNTWTRIDGMPNTLVSATGIYGTNKLGQASATIDAMPAYTLATAATKAPKVVKGETTVTVSAGDDYALADDGNPEGTEYAIRVTTSNNGEDLVSTNDVPVWKTLNEWKADEPLVVASPTIDLEATNYFSFVTRNFGEDPKETFTTVTTNCWFDMTAGFVGSPTQKGAASQDDASFGKVAVSVEFFDPAQGDGAVALIEYRIDRGEWTPWLNIPVSFDELSVTTNLDWDAWVAVGRVQGEYVYNLRAKVSAGNRESAWAVFDEGTLDFAPPTNLAISGSPANAETTSATGYNFSFSATDSNDVAFGWTLTGGTHGTGGTAAGGNLPDGSYTLAVTATDAMGNVCDAVNRNWTVDTTSPTGLAFVVAPEDGAVTNLASFSIAASADDATALTYHWALNGMDAAGTAATYVGEAREGTNTVSVYVEDAAGNVCSAVTRTWVVDTIAPTAPVITGKPATLTNTPAFTMDAASDDATALTYHWTFNGSGLVGASLADNAREGSNSVSVYATDEAGNVSETTSYSWTLDTTAPSGLAISGTPAQGAVTANSAVGLTASATDAHAITYRWTFNGVASEGAALNATAQEGANTASVVAIDAAGNETAAVTRTWTLDTTKPTNLAVGGTPTNGSLVNAPAFSFTASASDATSLSYRWTLNGVVANTTGDTFAGTAVERENTVIVYAEDAAGNKSDEATVSWTLDTTAPTGLAIDGTPAQGAVTANGAVSLTASATDVHTITYRWTFNGVASEGAALNATAKEGENTASVVAVDAAGNACAAVTRTWTLDTTAPANLSVAGTPADGSIVNASAFDFTASASDATTITYHWTFGEETAAVTNFTGTAGNDGEYMVSVYAEDAAGNKSEPVAVSWTLDTVAPAGLAIDGTPAQGAVTANDAVSLTASATDDNAITYRWTFNGVASEGAALNATAKDGENTASVVAVDAAGNACAAVTRTWTLDTTAPTNLAIAGAPVEGAATNDTAFNFTAFAEDDSKPLAYHWKLSWTSVPGVTGEKDIDGTSSNCVDVAVENATNVVSVYAVDAAGNPCDPVTRTWVVDTVAPSMPEFDEKPDSFTNGSGYRFVVSSTDALSGVSEYFWSFDGGVFEPGSATLEGVVAESREYELLVYAVDAAGNSSATNSYTWTIDATKPTVTLESNTPNPFNANDTFTVTVTFSEKVTGFAADKVTVANGSVSALTESQDEENTNKVFVVTIVPDNDDVTSISVQVEADKVQDLAGNWNEASETLSSSCVLKRPTVTLSTQTASYFHKGENFAVAVEFSGVVTDFSASSLTVENGSATVEGSGALYTVTITPINDGAISVQIGDNMVHDTAGNGNVASSILVRTYDTTAPTGIVLAGTPANGSTTNSKDFEITVESVVEANAAAGLIYQWSIDDGQYKTGPVTYTGSVEPGEHYVRVKIRDKAQNWSEVSSAWTWTYEKPVTSGIEFDGGVTLPVNPDTGATNAVEFVTIDFKPGDACSFSLKGFEATGTNISNLQMWFVVGETLGGPRAHVKVSTNATYNETDKELIVTLPATATQGKSSFFIFGIDNKGE